MSSFLQAENSNSAEPTTSLTHRAGADFAERVANLPPCDVKLDWPPPPQRPMFLVDPDTSITIGERPLSNLARSVLDTYREADGQVHYLFCQVLQSASDPVAIHRQAAILGFLALKAHVYRQQYKTVAAGLNYPNQEKTPSFDERKLTGVPTTIEALPDDLTSVGADGKVSTHGKYHRMFTDPPYGLLKSIIPEPQTYFDVFHQMLFDTLPLEEHQVYAWSDDASDYCQCQNEMSAKWQK